MAKNFTIGIDLGGTKVSFALVDEKGKVIRHHKEPSEKSSPKALAVQLAENCGRLLLLAKKNKNAILGIGLASAGPLNVKTGKLLYPSNFLGWKIVPIVALLKAELKRRKIQLPISFQNDAMAAALGEGWIGGARGKNTFAVITLGTGIGSGVIYKGSPLQWDGMGGEWGIQLIHFPMVLEGGETYLASVEGMASGTGIAKRARALGYQGNGVEGIRAELEAGNLKYLPLFHEAGIALAILCYNISLALHPDRILFTGGLMHMKEYFFPSMQKKYKELIEKHPGFAVNISQAKLGFSAGVVGAARLPRLQKHMS